MKMPRLTPYFGIATALLVVFLILSFTESTGVVRAPTQRADIASSTLGVIATLPLELPTLELGSTATATASEPKETPAPAKPALTPTTSAPVAAPVAPAPTPAPPPLSTAETNSALDASATKIRAALVNIICYVPSGSSLHSISGSGIFVDSKGIILTNAHIAQYFLLADRGAECTIRAGSPAVDKYEASLIYIPPAWLKANSKVLTQTAPSGTGEYDFALLAVTKGTAFSPLPDSFPYIPLATKPSSTGTPVVIASYGAQFLESNQIQSSLFPTIVFGSVKDIFTFASTTIDVLALGGSAAAQEGSSGGGIVDISGKLVGTITTSTVKGSTDTRSLSAITASYIRSAYASETGEALDLLLDQPIAVSVSDFASQIPELESILSLP